MITFALSLLLVFKTNSSYSRWWEGRIIWGQVRWRRGAGHGWVCLEQECDQQVGVQTGNQQNKVWTSCVHAQVMYSQTGRLRTASVCLRVRTHSEYS